MIDRELPKRAHQARREPQIRRCKWPAGQARAAGGLPHPANRQMIALQEPASGESRIIKATRNRSFLTTLPTTTYHPTALVHPRLVGCANGACPWQARSTAYSGRNKAERPV